MIPALREAYNSSFTKERYKEFLARLDAVHPGAIEFRVAETPIFVPAEFYKKMEACCEYIVSVIQDPAFIKNTEEAIPSALRVPAENPVPDFIAFDFGICISADGEYEPQLIEMQGFPSLFAFEVHLPEVMAQTFAAPKGFDCYLNGHTKSSYLDLLRSIVLNGHDPEEVILLELFPHQQKTRIDFYCTQDYLGIEPVCLTELEKEGNQIFYTNNAGKRIRIKRVYNRIIFDELLQQSDEIREKGKILFEDLDISWCSHPNWFYRVSKYTLPFLRNQYIPETWFLNELKQPPADLENYVLKPLFSFAGQGVVIDVHSDDLAAVKDPQNWILQRKVNYAEVIQTPDVPAKAEIRIFYFWPPGASKPEPTNNLARLSKGKMVGVRYNKDKEWVGGTFCLIEQEKK